VEILRFGPGFRRTVPPAGSRGLAEQTIWSDSRARVTELAFSRRALLGPQTSPDHALFVVVSGGGWVQVGDERTAINHGEAVAWPPGVPHGAWTDGSQMRAVLVEVPDLAIEASQHRPAEAPTVTALDAAGEVETARGGLAARELRPEDHVATEGEPW
jgi:quercetin dioxygenase-like cupin family protein